MTYTRLNTKREPSHNQLTDVIELSRIETVELFSYIEKPTINHDLSSSHHHQDIEEKTSRKHRLRNEKAQTHYYY